MNIDVDRKWRRSIEEAEWLKAAPIGPYCSTD